MMTLGARCVAYLTLLFAGLAGATSMLLFMLFLFTGSLGMVDLALGRVTLLAWDALLCLAFFVQHSGMIRRSFRRWSEGFLPSHYQRALYTIASGGVLLLLVVFWQKADETLIELQGAYRWLAQGVFLLSLVGTAWGMRALGSLDAFGLDPILQRVRGTHPNPMPFAVRGPYRWVRHPLYLFMLLLIWSCQVVTTDRLLFNILCTAWMLVGTVLEERDLVADFGNAYREYQRTVPMLIPWRMRPAR